MVCISEVSLRRKPSLSASRMATSETSGRSSPSRSRLTPTSTSNCPLAQLAEQFDPLEGVQFAVQPLAADVLLAEIGGQVLGQPLGERGHQHALADGRPLANLLQQVRHLASGPARLRSPGRAGRWGESPARPPRRRSSPAHRAPAWPRRRPPGLTRLFPLLEPQRPVVQRAGQAEAVLHQRHLAVVVAGVHAADLRHA